MPQICIDYTNIDRLVDEAADNKVLSFLDAYFGYNQIQMVATDMNKTTFITNDANYFCKVMPFGLKNANATYQRLMDKVFSHLMGKCVEVYVDDMVIKSPSHLQHAQDLLMSSNFCPHLIFKFGDLIEFSVLKD